MSVTIFYRTKLPSWFSEEAYSGCEQFSEQDWARAILIRHYAWKYSSALVLPAVHLPAPTYTYMDELLRSVEMIAERTQFNLAKSNLNEDLVNTCQSTLERSTQTFSLVSAFWDYIIAIRAEVVAKNLSKKLKKSLSNVTLQIYKNLETLLDLWNKGLNNRNGITTNFFDIEKKCRNQNWDLLEKSDGLFSDNKIYETTNWDQVYQIALSKHPILLKSWLEVEISKISHYKKQTEYDQVVCASNIPDLLGRIINNAIVPLWRANYSLQYFGEILGYPLPVSLIQQGSANESFEIKYDEQDGTHPIWNIMTQSQYIPAVKTLVFRDLIWQRSHDLVFKSILTKCWYLLEQTHPQINEDNWAYGPSVSTTALSVIELVNQRQANEKEFETPVTLLGDIAVCSVDLNNSDTEIYKAFKKWLKEQRKQPNAIKPKNKTMSKWHSYQVLPYIDLLLWESIDPHFHPTREQMADILYMDTVQLRDTVEPLAKSLLGSCNWLIPLTK